MPDNTSSSSSTVHYLIIIIINKILLLLLLLNLLKNYIYNLNLCKVTTLTTLKWTTQHPLTLSPLYNK